MKLITHANNGSKASKERIFRKTVFFLKYSDNAATTNILKVSYLEQQTMGIVSTAPIVSHVWGEE
jgi:hypothetical protein